MSKIWLTWHDKRGVHTENGYNLAQALLRARALNIWLNVKCEVCQTRYYGVYHINLVLWEIDEYGNEKTYSWFDSAE